MVSYQILHTIINYTEVYVNYLQRLQTFLSDFLHSFYYHTLTLIPWTA